MGLLAEEVVRLAGDRPGRSGRSGVAEWQVLLLVSGVMKVVWHGTLQGFRVWLQGVLG